MARISNQEKIKRLEEQIKENRRKMREIQNQMYRNIGKEVMREWEIDDEQEAIRIIKILKNQIDQLKNN